jgi:hypothetical protein
MRHYVILSDCAVEGMGYHEAHAVAVAHSLRKAKRILAKKVAEERQYAVEHDWTVLIDCAKEFDAGESGNYESEHAHFYIEKI